MSKKLGIENLKTAIAFLIGLAEALERRFDDKKINFLEAITLLPKFKNLPQIIRSAEDIKDEFLDLDEAELVEIQEFVKKNLDLKNDEVEEVIEKAVEVLVSLSSVVNVFSRSGEPGQGPTDPR